jgi:hypothetical protein
MVKSEFISRLERIDQVNGQDFDDLKDITRTYPYFQAAKALYLKSLKAVSSIDYNQELKYTAAQTIDRSVLFDLITSESFVTKENDDSENELGEDPIHFKTGDEYSFTEWLKIGSSTPKKKPKETQESNSSNSLIDKFLKGNPKMPKAEKSSVMTPANSINDSNIDGLMTETLAKVYLAQKKYENALVAYRILSLKNPEKSSFFANQITKIEQLQKNKS